MAPASADHFRTPAAEARAEIRVQRSRFLAIAFPMSAEEEFDARLEAIRSTFFDATHHCWAWRLFAGERARSSDAGEPSGSAGRPILQAIRAAALHDAGVVVVRWFGGVKLGTGGLGRAYRDAAAAALADAPIEDRWIYERIAFATAHRDANTIFRMVHPPDVVLAASDFGAEAYFELDVRTSMVERVVAELERHRVNVRKGR